MQIKLPFGIGNLFSKSPEQGDAPSQVRDRQNMFNGKVECAPTRSPQEAKTAVQTKAHSFLTSLEKRFTSLAGGFLACLGGNMSDEEVEAKMKALNQELPGLG